MSKNIIIYDRIAHDHIDHWLMGLLSYLKNKGFNVQCRYDRFNYDKDIKDCCAVMCWNGQQAIHEPIKYTCKKYDVPFWYVECAFFPQSKYYYLDKKGINASMSLMDDDLSWVTQEHIHQFNIFREKYLAGRKYNGRGEYILAPLQIESDTNIIKHSQFKTMQAFIDYVENKYPNDKVLFKTHPVQHMLSYRTKYPLIRNGQFLSLAQNAKLVVGINSTCLLESLMLGAPTIALGEGLVKKHSNNIEKLLAALVDIQIPINETNLDKWLLPIFE